MANNKEVPVSFIVDHAKAQKSALAASPYRTLLNDWFSEIHCEIEGYESLRAIDAHFSDENTGAKTISLGEAVVLPGTILGRFRTEPASALLLYSIIHEIHRRMTIPLAESRKAKRPEDVRHSSWTWPHVMRVMIRRGIMADTTTKAQFGATIEQILGNKVKPNSIRRVNNGDYSVATLWDYDLTDVDKDVCNEILELFMPLLMPKN